MRSVLISLIVMLPTVAFGSETRTVSVEGFGCLALQDFERSVTFAAQDDAAALTKFMAQKSSVGDCRPLHVGQAVFIENSSDNGRICLRPKGDVDCLWTSGAIFE